MLPWREEIPRCLMGYCTKDLTVQNERPRIQVAGEGECVSCSDSDSLLAGPLYVFHHLQASWFFPGISSKVVLHNGEDLAIFMYLLPSTSNKIKSKREIETISRIFLDVLHQHWTISAERWKFLGNERRNRIQRSVILRFDRASSLLLLAIKLARSVR